MRHTPLVALLALALLAVGSSSALVPPTPVLAPATADALLPCSESATDVPAPHWAADLTAAAATNVTKEDVQVESADGTLLSARVYLPDAFARPLPTILIQSPYHSLAGIYFKELEDATVFDYADCDVGYFVARGYAVVLGDMRGTHNSDGCFDYGGPGDQMDGYALVEWIAAQEWSSGKVGMYGVSHVGMSQYAAAVAAPPHLTAILPIAPITSFYRYLYSGGVHYETNMATPAAYDYAVAAPPPTNVLAPNWATNVAGTPCALPGTLHGMDTAGTFTDYWRERDYASMAGNIRAAVFHAHGTFDENVKMDHFTAIWDALEAQGVERKALIGPWAHSYPDIPWWNATALRWFEHHLKGIDTGMMEEPAVTTIDQTGVERTADSFPPEGHDDDKRVLHLSRGALAEEPLLGTASYTDNPAIPRALMRDATDHRVVYTSRELDEPLRIAGAPVLELAATIDANDTNFAVHLYDVWPDGSAQYVTRGYADAKHRFGLDAPVAVPEGVMQRYRVELHARDHVFAEGHRIEVLITSTDHCPWLVSGHVFNDVCSSSGVVSDDTLAAVTVHEGEGLTRLRLPVADR